MKNNTTIVRLILASLAALAMLAFLVLGWLHVKKVNRETAGLSVAAGESARLETEERMIRNIRSEAAAEIRAFEAFTLDNEKLVSLIESVEETGRALKLDLKIDSVEKKESEGAAPQVIRIAVSAQGSWASAYMFLRAVEALPYRVMIERVNLTKDNAAWSETVVFSVHSFK